MTTTTLPLLEKMDFRRAAFQIRDPWRNTVRTCRKVGVCAVCFVGVFEFDDGENDPRGLLGDRADCGLTASEFGKVGPDVPMCFPCANEESRYNIGVKRAMKRWKDAIR